MPQYRVCYTRGDSSNIHHGLCIGLQFERFSSSDHLLDHYLELERSGAEPFGPAMEWYHPLYKVNKKFPLLHRLDFSNN